MNHQIIQELIAARNLARLRLRLAENMNDLVTIAEVLTLIAEIDSSIAYRLYGEEQKAA